MYYRIKRFIKQFLIGPVAALILIVPLFFYREAAGPEYGLPGSRESAFQAGLFFTLSYYFIGARLRDCIFNSRDLQLAVITPLTPRLLILQSFKNYAGFLLWFWLINPILFLGIISPYGANPLHPLAGLNCAAAYLLLMVLPIQLFLVKNPWPWNLFFFARPLVMRLLHIFFLFPLQFCGSRGRLRYSLLWFLALGLAVYFYHAAIFSWVLALHDAVLALGAPGKFILFLFIPFYGIIHFITPGAPANLPLFLLAFLVIMLFICFASLRRMMNTHPSVLEASRVDWWVENRELYEAEQAENVTPQAAGSLVPWEEAAPQPSAAPALASPAKPTIPPPPRILPDMDYRPALSAPAQLEHHSRHWATPQGFITLVIGLAFLFLIQYKAIVRSGFFSESFLTWIRRPHRELAAFIIVAACCLFFWRASQLGRYVQWSAVVPIRWPAALMHTLFRYNKNDLLVTAICLGVIYALMGLSLPDFVLCILVGFLLRVYSGLLYWLYTRSRAGRRRLYYAYIILSILGIVPGLIPTVVVLSQDSFNGLLTNIALLIGLMIVLALLCLAWAGRRDDHTINAPPVSSPIDFHPDETI